MTNALRTSLALDNNDFIAKMVQAGQVTEREAAKIVRAYKYAGDQARALAQTQQSANDAVGNFSANADHASRASSGMTRELIVLGHELATGRYTRFGGSLLVIAEYSQVATKALSLLVGPIGLAIGALGALGLILHMGSSEQDKFNTSLVRTGNFAGVTAASFEDMANRVSGATHATIGTSKEALQALVSTGQIGQRSLESAGQATVAMERLTGESADKIAGDFAKMSEGVAKWAGEHNRQMHFITVAEYEQIAAMEKAGNTAGAMEKVFDAINAKNAELTTSTGYLSKAWEGLAGWISKAKDAMMQWGATSTTAQQLASVQEKLQAAEDSLGREMKLSTFTPQQIHSTETAIAGYRAEAAALQEKLRLEQKSADLQASSDAKNQNAIDKLMHPEKAAHEKAPHQYKGLNFMGPPTFDQMYPKADSSAIMKYQKDNASAQRLAIEQEVKDAETLSKTFEKYKPQASTGFDAAINSYLKHISDGAKQTEKLVNDSFRGMENALMNFVTTGKLSFRDLFSTMAQDFLHMEMGKAENFLFGNGTPGTGVNWGSVASSVFSFLGIGSHANGLDYVPYDGYPAILHKGERVQTAVEASAGRGGSQAPTINMSTSIGSVGAGVNRAEMAGAMAQNNRAQKAQLQRLRLQGLLT